MNPAVPPTLQQWLERIGVDKQITTQALEDGSVVSAAMHTVIEGCTLRLTNDDTNANWDLIIQQLSKAKIAIKEDLLDRLYDKKHEAIYELLVALKDHHEKHQKETQVDINRLDLKKDPRESTSLLELMILVIMKNFGLNSKQAVALLSNDSKYLAHILAKGLKGKFRPIQDFILDLKRSVPVIQNFCRNKQNQTFFLKSIKPGPISKSEIVAEQSLDLMMLFLSTHPNQFDVLRDQLISTFILGIRRHPNIAPTIVSAILAMSNYNKGLLELIKQNGTAADFQTVTREIWKIALSEDRADDVVKMKGFKTFIDSLIGSLGISDSVIPALSLLVNLCEFDTAVVFDAERTSKIIDNLANVAISKQGESLSFANLIFAILAFLGKDKNSAAPALYKLIIEKFQNCQSENEADNYVENLINTLQTFTSIPCAPILDAINIRAEQGIFNVKTPEIVLLKAIINSQTADVKMVLIIYNIVSKVMLEDVSLGLWVGDFITTFVSKYPDQQIIVDMTLKLLKVCLAVHYANVKKVVANKRSSYSSRGSSDEMALLQMKNLVIEQFMKRILQLNLKQFMQSLEPLLTYSYIQVNAASRQQAQGLYKLLKMIGNPEQLVGKYTTPKEEEKKPHQRGKSHNQSGIKNRYRETEVNRDNQQSGSSDQVNLLTRKKGLSGNSSNPLYLSHLSTVGVLPDAQKGLQKYQKVYLQRIQKLEGEKAKKVAEQQRASQLKKMYERKLHDLGMSARPDEVVDTLYQFDSKQKVLEEQKVRGRADIPMFKSDIEEERDQKALEHFMKKYNRALKLYFNQYLGGKKVGAYKNFDEIAERSNVIQMAATWKMLRDHTLDEFISLQQAKTVVRRVNYSLKREHPEVLSLDFQGFEQFIIQTSFVMFTRPPKDLRGHPVSEMVDETFSRFRLYAGDNKMDPRIFQQPQSIYYNETEAVRQLNKKLEENPNYIVPEGYKKIVEKKVNFSHKIFLEALSPTYKSVYETLDEILHQVLGFHIIEPFSTLQTVSRARPALYFIQRTEGDLNFQVNISYNMKKQVARIPIKDRQIAKQAAGILQDIIEAVQYGHDKIGVRYQNKLLRDKKQRQQEIRRKQEQEKKKRLQRDKELKTFIDQHKDKVAQKKKEQVSKKRQQKDKQESKKKKKEKQEQQLKKKVEEYQAKKKDDQKKQRVMSRERKQKQKDQMERKKKQIDQTRRKIEQAKGKKAEQIQEKKRQEEHEQRRKKEEEKRKTLEKQKDMKQKVQEYKQKRSSVIKDGKSPQKDNQAPQDKQGDNESQ